MTYDQTDLIQALAAEYVIGSLRGPARRRFERLLDTRTDVREQVSFWELRLGALGRCAMPVTPPRHLRAELLQRADVPAPEHARLMRPPPTPAPNPRRHRSWGWPYAAGFASAAALVLAFIVGQRHPPSEDAAPNPQSISVQQEMPIYAAQIGMPASEVQWLLSVSPDHRQLTVVAARDFLQIGRRKVQLWGMAPGQNAVAIGVLPAQGNASASFKVPTQLQGAADVRFLISLEPDDDRHRQRPGSLVFTSASPQSGI